MRKRRPDRLHARRRYVSFFGGCGCRSRRGWLFHDDLLRGCGRRYYRCARHFHRASFGGGNGVKQATFLGAFAYRHFFELGIRWAVGEKLVLQFLSDILVNRAGVRLFLFNAEFGQQLENPVRLDLELACQLVDTNFLHMLQYCSNLAPNLLRPHWFSPLAGLSVAG